MNKGVDTPMWLMGSWQPELVTSIEQLQLGSISQMKMQILKNNWTEMGTHYAGTGVAGILWHLHLQTGWSQF